MAVVGGGLGLRASCTGLGALAFPLYIEADQPPWPLGQTDLEEGSPSSNRTHPPFLTSLGTRGLLLSLVWPVSVGPMHPTAHGGPPSGV
jgi:hypothetical protein